MADFDELKAKLETSVAELRDANADWLDHLAERLEDSRFRSAAAMLRGNPPGRRAADDEKAVNHAMRLLQTGFAQSSHDAARKAARLYAEPHYMRAATDRIRKKLRSKLIKSKTEL
jgi:hypothetical protein